MKHTLETIKKALQSHFQQQDAVSFSKLKHEVEGFIKELQEQTETWRLEDLVLATKGYKGYFESHKDERWIKVSKILGDK